MSITVTFPVVAPIGTIAIILVALLEIIVADIPLNFTAAPDKFPELAVIVISVPIGPEVGDILDSTAAVQGGGTIVIVFPIAFPVGNPNGKIVAFKLLLDDILALMVLPFTALIETSPTNK